MPKYSSTGSSLGTSIETGEITAGAVTLDKIDATTVKDLYIGKWRLFEVIDCSAGVTTIDFSAIPAAAKVIKIIGHLESNHTAQNTIALMFNDDAGANYDYQYVNNATVIHTTGGNQLSILNLRGSTNGAERGIVNAVLHTQPKSGRNFIEVAVTAKGSLDAGSSVFFCGGRWHNAGAAITKITVEDAGSRSFKGYLALYYSEDITS